MEHVVITRDDIKKRVYFITKLVQNQRGATMQGALTSKSDAMGGIFDRFINTLSDSLVFDKIIFQRPEIRVLGKKIKAIDDFYFYRPNENSAGIAPDIFGIDIDGIVFPFVKFEDKWTAVDGTPQIEVKTFKAKDQMISLRNQHYDDEYLVLVDLDLRIDYLVPFLDTKMLDENVLSDMEMDDKVFIVSDRNNLISKITEIDFSDRKIGTMSLISITNAGDFMKQSTLCGGGISVFRMKDIKERKVKMKSGLIHEKLSSLSNKSERVHGLYKYNSNFKANFVSGEKTEFLDFAAENIENIEIIKFNRMGMVIRALDEGCSFNCFSIKKGEQYSVSFDILDRSGNGGSEYFMQKQCARYLTSLENKLVNEIISVVR